MSDVQLLCVVVLALYVWECACWLKRGSVAFSSWLGRHWTLLHPGSLIANQAGGFVLATPAPPMGTLFVTNQFPLSLSPDGALAFVSTNVNPGWRPAQSGRFVRFEDIKETQVEDRKVLINGEPLVRCASPSTARYCAEQLQRIAKLEISERGNAITQLLENAFDLKAVEARTIDFRKQVKPVRHLTNALLVYVFVLIPASIWMIGFKLTWLWLLIGMLALSGTTAFLFARAFRRLYPKADDERFTHTLTILLAPSTAMRAHDALSRPLLENFHPLAAARTLLPKEEFKEFARRTLLDVRHPALPQTPTSEPVVTATETFARVALQKQIESFLRQNGLSPEDLSASPVPADKTCVAYCPRCSVQFTTLDSNCADCGGLSVIPFDKPKSA